MHIYLGKARKIINYEKNYCICILAVLFNSCNKQTSSVAISQNSSQQKIPYSLHKSKPWWAYALIDAGGAWTWGSRGKILGTTGIATGIVIGGVCTTAWAWYWDNSSKAKLVPSNTDTTDNSYYNKYDQVGYLHNKFLLNTDSMSFIGDSIISVADFANAIYDTLTHFTADELNLNVQDIRSLFTKQDLIDRIQLYKDSVLSDLGNVRAFQGWIGSTATDPAQVTNFYSQTQLGIDSIGSENITGIIAYLNQRQDWLANSSSWNSDDKEVMMYALSVWKYSSVLWH
ncbi:MAG: hypothetical protein JST06_05270 [Bacteroidetes bacterium]|nr:hypothetical protein [Bacteroidota bacterium]MBS1629838.1 hypothetical protein [Bacteroidota bacterium]